MQSLSWSSSQAETALFAHLQEHSIPILASSIDGTPIAAAAVRESEPTAHVVSEFVIEVSQKDPEAFGYLDTVVKGAMLASVLFYPELGQVPKRFERLDAYFDTPVILRAIGAHGSTAERSAVQVLQLAYELGIRPKCFQSTFDETFGVLNAAARELRRYGAFTMSTSETVEYLLEEGFDASDVELLISKLESVLESLHIEVVPRPEPDPDLTVDEAKFEAVLQAEVQYRRPEALKHDLDAATAIHRLRRGQLCRTLERAGAIFVTTNSSLAHGTRLFFREVYGGTGVPPITLDHHLGTLLWLKKPTAAPDLPRDLLVASCYAALNPPDQLWRRYLQEIDKLRVRGDITPEDYHLLRFDLSSKSSLLTLTGGKQDAFADGTVREVLRRAKANAAREATQMASEAQAAAREHEGAAKAAQRSAEAVSAHTASERLQRRLRYRQIGNAAGTGARWTLLGTAFVLALLAGLLSEGLLSSPLRLALIGVGVLLTALSVFDISVGRWVRGRAFALEAAVAKWTSNKAERWIEGSAPDVRA